jgi:hypothetical protein
VPTLTEYLEKYEERIKQGDFSSSCPRGGSHGACPILMGYRDELLDGIDPKNPTTVAALERALTYLVFRDDVQTRNDPCSPTTCENNI